MSQEKKLKVESQPIPRIHVLGDNNSQENFFIKYL